MVIFFGRNHARPNVTTAGGLSEQQLNDEILESFRHDCAANGWELEYVTGQTAEQAEKISKRITELGLPGNGNWVSIQVHMNAKTKPGTDLFHHQGSKLSRNLAMEMGIFMESAGVPMPRLSLWRIPDARFSNLTFVDKAPTPAVLVEVGLAADPVFAAWIEKLENRQILGSALFMAIKIGLESSVVVGEWGKK